MKNKLIIVFLILLIILVNTFTVFANTNNSPLILNAEISNFNVTVPLGLPITLLQDGTVITASNARIINNSVGPVLVKDVLLNSTNGWQIDEFDLNYFEKKVDLKEFGFHINNENIDKLSGKPALDVLNWSSIAADGGFLSINYNAKVVPQSNVIDAENIGNVVFTVDWDYGIEDSTGEKSYAIEDLIDINVDGEISISQFYKDLGMEAPMVINIPSKINEITVTKIAAYGFESLINLKSLNLPDSIIEIGQNSFTYCIQLNNINIPEGVVTINDSAFVNCYSLKNIDIPLSVVNIGNEVFVNFNEIYNASIKMVGRTNFDGMTLGNNWYGGNTIEFEL